MQSSGTDGRRTNRVYVPVWPSNVEGERDALLQARTIHCVNLADFSNAGSLTGGCQTGEGRKSNGIRRPFPGALILRWVVTALRKALKATIPADDK